MRNDNTAGLLIALTVAAAAVASTALAQQKQTYKWVDDQGVVHYTDKIPPDQVNRGATVLNRDAIPVRKIDPPLTPEERAAKEEEARRDAAAARARAETERADRALMESFTNADEITLAKNRALATINAQIQSTMAFISDLSQRRDDLAASKEASGSRPVPESIENDLDMVNGEIAKQQALIEAKNREHAVMTARYDGFMARWLALKAAADARAAADAKAGK
jgi:hypothetical protein